MHTQAFLFARHTARSVHFVASKTAPRSFIRGGKKRMLEWNNVTLDELSPPVAACVKRAMANFKTFTNRQTLEINLETFALHLNQSPGVRATYLPKNAGAPARIMIQEDV